LLVLLRTWWQCSFLDRSKCCGIGIKGNRKVLDQLAATLADFQVALEIIPGTVPKTVAEEELNDFEVGPIVTAHE